MLFAQGNTLLCHYTVCIHIDFLPHHHPLWGNVNNAWRSAIARCLFARLLLSGTHSYLTCNFLWRSIVLQSTIIHFHLPAALPWDAESKSRHTLDTVNSEFKVLESGVESSLNIGITPLILQKKGILLKTFLHHSSVILQKVLPNKTYVFIFFSGNFCKLYFPWGCSFLLFSFFSCIHRWQHKAPWVNVTYFLLLGDLRAQWVLIPLGSLPSFLFSLLTLYPMDLTLTFSEHMDYPCSADMCQLVPTFGRSESMCVRQRKR